MALSPGPGELLKVSCISEFKKSELHKYKAPQSSPDTKKPSATG